MLEELGTRIDRKRVHLFGRIPRSLKNFTDAVIYMLSLKSIRIELEFT